VAAVDGCWPNEAEGNRSEQDHRRLGRDLRLGVIGAQKSFIRRGAPQAPSTRRGRGSVLSSNPERSRQAGRKLMPSPELAYGSAMEMLAIETSRRTAWRSSQSDAAGHGADLTPGERGRPPRLARRSRRPPDAD
jgi:hypothetical protein